MSYNTRNTRQGQGAGRGGSGTAQINYHQQQTRPGVQAQTQARLPTNAGGVPSSGYGQQAAQVPYTGQTASMPAFSTQPKPQATPQAASPKVYEYQNQQQAAPVTKTEPITPNKEEAEVESDVESPKDGCKKLWANKKLLGLKVNRKVKRRRQNARLRKILQPKNAIMVLNELKSGVKFTFHEQPSAIAQTSFVVNAEVDGKNHIGQGPSKPLAKQNAAENALKSLLLEKMAAAAQVKTEPMDHDGVVAPAVADNGDGVEEIDDLKPEGEDKPGAPEDEVPWGSLASFALFKLFTDWQNQGIHVPIAKSTLTSAPATANAKPPSTAPMKQIPDNATDRHPVMLLTQMRPGCKFVESKREGTAPNMTFTLSVTVDGVEYTGAAKNKKDAKKEAAKAALLGCLDIVYD